MLLNKLFLVIFLLFVLSCQKNNDVDKSYTYDNGNVGILNGHVKQIRSFSKGHNGVKVVDTINFDRRGNQIEVIEGESVFRYKEKYSTIYDKNGRIIQTTVVGTEMKGIYTYDKDGYSIKVLYGPEQRPNQIHVGQIYKYDKSGCLTESVNYLNPKELSTVLKSKYDKNYNLMQIEECSMTGKLLLIQKIKYLAWDSKNNWTEIEVTTKDFFFNPAKVRMNKSTREIDYY